MSSPELASSLLLLDLVAHSALSRPSWGGGGAPVAAGGGGGGGVLPPGSPPAAGFAAGALGSPTGGAFGVGAGGGRAPSALLARAATQSSPKRGAAENSGQTASESSLRCGSCEKGCGDESGSEEGQSEGCTGLFGF